MNVVPKIAVIIPVWNFWDYAVDCVESLLATTPGVRAILIDDCSPSRPPPAWLKSKILTSNGQHIYTRHKYNMQLTAAWNTGFQRTFAATDAEYIVAGNSDILFSPGWWESLEYASQKGYHLVGPITNTPGNTTQQDVKRFVSDYEPANDPVSIGKVTSRLSVLKGHVEPTLINGFFMWAKAEHWNEGRFSAEHIFRPSNPRFKSGRKNPTPLMTGNEDELQLRWKAKGWKFGVACGSFIFHYRSVTRGVKYAKGRWSRK